MPEYGAEHPSLDETYYRKSLTLYILNMNSNKLGSFSTDLAMSSNEAFGAVQRVIGTSDLAIKASTPGTSIIAEGGRDFKWVWLILLILLFWPGAIVYYFTRKENSISVSIFPKQPGSSISVSSQGRKGDHALNLLSSAVR
ncbi:MAG TPA: hypothetical protein VFE98_04325 [Candidatus Bathyarchaeia archaeon]|nr:hypothetical protein [Candidatus Bathyarchaeia archaeon]